MRFWHRILAGVGLSALCLSGYGQAPDLEKMDFVLRSVPDGPVAKAAALLEAQADGVIRRIVGGAAGNGLDANGVVGPSG